MASLLGTNWTFTSTNNKFGPFTAQFAGKGIAYLKFFNNGKSMRGIWSQNTRTGTFTMSIAGYINQNWVDQGVVAGTHQDGQGTGTWTSTGGWGTSVMPFVMTEEKPAYVTPLLGTTWTFTPTTTGDFPAFTVQFVSQTTADVQLADGSTVQGSWTHGPRNVTFTLIFEDTYGEHWQVVGTHQNQWGTGTAVLDAGGGPQTSSFIMAPEGIGQPTVASLLNTSWMFYSGGGAWEVKFAANGVAYIRGNYASFMGRWVQSPGNIAFELVGQLAGNPSINRFIGTHDNAAGSGILYSPLWGSTYTSPFTMRLLASPFPAAAW